MILTYLNDYLAQNRGLSVQSATGMLLALGLGGGVGVMGGGFLGQWLYNRHKWAVSVFIGECVGGEGPGGGGGAGGGGGGGRAGRGARCEAALQESNPCCNPLPAQAAARCWAWFPSTGSSTLMSPSTCCLRLWLPPRWASSAASWAPT